MRTECRRRERPILGVAIGATGDQVSPGVAIILICRCVLLFSSRSWTSAKRGIALRLPSDGRLSI